MQARLSHRNLVAVYELGLADGTYYVQMDYVDGGDLASLMKLSRPSLALALHVAEEIALALHYVHNFQDGHARPLGLVHRDISPSNILLSRAGEIKLADFGVVKATHLADGTGARVRKGKYAYMSPEQVAGEPLTGQSDQFGLGVTLMEMIVGHRPFDGETVHETMAKIRACEPPRLDGVDPALRDVMLRCVRLHPGDRYPSALALHQELTRLQQQYGRAGAPDVQEYVNDTAVQGPSIADEKTQV